MMDEIFADMINGGIVIIYMDNIFIFQVAPVWSGLRDTQTGD